MKISLVVNTFNEENNLTRCLESIKDFADEIIVVDMHSTDKTRQIAKDFGAKIFEYDYTRYVEPARNFALSKAKGDWILVLDADETIEPELKKLLKETAGDQEINFVEIPRKNIIFGKWIKNSRWWPDYLTRFFRKGKIKYSERIHIPPSVEGKGLKLQDLEENAIVHYNLQTISQSIDRMNRYTDIQSDELIESGYKFHWPDLIIKPTNEFLSRFFFGEGYKDGVHGLALGLLQLFSEAVVYMKVWEKRGFEEEEVKGFGKIFEKMVNDYLYWIRETSLNTLDKVRLKLKAKI